MAGSYAIRTEPVGEFAHVIVVVPPTNGGDMPRPLLTDVKLIRKTVMVHPVEWGQYLALMQATDNSASRRIRAFIRSELKRAKERAKA